MEVVEHRQERCGNASLDRSASKLLDAWPPSAASNPISMHRGVSGQLYLWTRACPVPLRADKAEPDLPHDRTSILLRYKHVIVKSTLQGMLLQQKHTRKSEEVQMKISFPHVRLNVM
jgi:hypothetical protein